MVAVDQLVAALRFPAHLRAKRVQGAQAVWELTWAPDGRAIFHTAKNARVTFLAPLTTRTGLALRAVPAPAAGFV